MDIETKRWPPARLAAALALALALPGCSMFGGSGSDALATATAEPAAADGEVDVRRFLGPDYCPELRIRPGAELVRSYERGHEGDPDYVVWQASVGETARECLYDPAGTLTLKVGVSGRVVAGPKGGPQTVTVPLRIAVVKHKEAVLLSELYPLAVTIPPQNSTVFREVRQVTVPSPGNDRDYILYVGFDEKGENLLDPAASLVAAVEEPVEVIPEPEPLPEERPAPRPRQQQAAPTPKPTPPPAASEPNVLPVPSGFVLPGG